MANNFFDRFDGNAQSAAGNFFDKFDEAPALPPGQYATSSGQEPNLLPLKRVPEGQGLLGSTYDIGPSKLTDAIGAIPGAVVDSLKQMGTAPRRALTDDNFDPESEARNFAGNLSGTGFALSAARRGAPTALRAAADALSETNAPEAAVTLGMNYIPKAAKATSRAAATIASPVVNFMDSEGAVGRTLARRMMQQNPGMSFDDALAKTMADQSALGDAGMLADTGESMGRLLRNMTQGPGETAQRAKDALGGRQAAEKTRMIGTLQANVSPEMFYDVSKEAKNIRKRSGPLFQKAFAENPNTTTPQLDLLLQQEPEIKRAMEKGLTILRGEASEDGVKFNASDYGVNARVDPDGNTIIDAINGTPLTLWHATKRGIDKLINAKKNAVGKLDTSDPDVQRLVGLRKSIDGELKNVTGGEKGDYARANAIASEGYQLQDALEAGRAFVRGDPEQLDMAFDKLKPRQKDAYRAGVVKEAVEMIGRDTSDLTPAQIMASIKAESSVRKKLQTIAPTDGQFNNIMKDIENNLKFRETNRTARNVSQTGSIAMEEGQLAGESMKEAPGIVGKALTGNIPGAVMQTVQWGLGQLGRLKMPQKTRDRLGEMLLSQDKGVQQQAFDAIKNARGNGWLYTP